MNRRSLLRMLLASPLAATFDVERLLWVPGHMVAVPAMPRVWDPAIGISVRFIQQWDIQTDQFTKRIDWMWQDAAMLSAFTDRQKIDSAANSVSE